MYYDEPVFRPPSEAGSLIIQATIGCPHNKCEFCFCYKSKKFRKRPMDDILADITTAKKMYGDYIRTIFLADGNTIILKTDELLEIVNFCYSMFPNLTRITSYGSARFIVKGKTLSDLKRLKKAGLNRIHMGLESGQGEVLKMMSKGATPEDMIKAGQMVRESGIELSEYVLLGLGGKALSREHAIETAKVLNAINPDFIRLRTLLIRPDAPLWKRFERKEFVPVTRLELLNETRLLLENLNCESEFYSDHVTNIVNLNGKLPGDKSAMLRDLDDMIEIVKNEPQDREWAVDRTGTRSL